MAALRVLRLTGDGVTATPHSPRHRADASLISRGPSVGAASRRLGHSSPEITYRAYAYPKPDDEQATRAPMAETPAQIIPDVYPVVYRETSS